MYDHAWRIYSRNRLARFPWCARCEAKGRARLAVVTDHVTPHKGDRVLFRDPRNHQSLCKPCHDHKTRTEDGGGGSRPTIAKPARRALCEHPDAPQETQWEAAGKPQPNR